MSRKPNKPTRRFVPSFEQLDARQLLSAGVVSGSSAAAYAAHGADALSPAAHAAAQPDDTAWSGGDSDTHVWYSNGANDSYARPMDLASGVTSSQGRTMTAPAGLPAMLSPMPAPVFVISAAPSVAPPVPVDSPPVPATPPVQPSPPAALANGEGSPPAAAPAVTLVGASEETGPGHASGPDSPSAAGAVRHGSTPEAETLAAQSPGLAASFLPSDPSVLEESVRQVLDRLDELAGPITTWGVEDRTSALWVFALAGTGAVGETLRRRYRERLPDWWATLTGSFRSARG